MEVVTLKYILKNLKISFVENTRQIYLDCPMCQSPQTLYVNKNSTNSAKSKDETYHCFSCQYQGNGFKEMLCACSQEYQDLCAFEEFSKTLPSKSKAESSNVKKCTCASHDLFHYGCRCGGV